MRSDIIKSHTCQKHGNIGEQILTIGYFDENRNFTQKSFCGRCHFDMIEACCHSVQHDPALDVKKKEKKLIITR